MDIATLGIKVTTDGVTKANADLDKLQASGKGAETSAAGIGKAWKGASAEVAASSATISESAIAAKASLDAFATPAGDPERIKAMVQASLAAAEADKAQLAAELALTGGITGRTAATDASIVSSRASAVAAAATRTAVTAQISDYGILDAVLEKKVRTDAEVATAAAALNRLRVAEALSTNELASAVERLNLVVNADTGVIEANTVAQLENAGARKVNSRVAAELGILGGELASGNISRMKRSTAALANQTGLLAKVFTPIGGLITGAALAIIGFGIAAFKGSQEEEKFNKALILTGNYSGQTSDSLANLAKQLSGFGTTQHAAAAALAEVAQSGAFTASQIGLVGKAALDMSKLTGQSVQETIKQFEKLQDEPLKAVTALDKAQHFLTTAVYEQIRALEEQGRTQDAANLAMQTYAQTVAQRTTEVTQNLGLIEKSWNGIKGAALGAIDAAMSYGRQLVGQEKFDDVFKKRQALIDDQSKGETFATTHNDSGGITGITSIQKQIDAYTKQLSDLQNAKESADKAANKRSIDSQATLALEQSDATAAIYATSAEKKKTEILAAFNKANADIEKEMAAGDTASAERVAKNYIKIEAGINAKYATAQHKTRVSRPVSTSRGDNALLAFQNQVTALGVNLDASNSPISKYTQGVARLSAEFDKATRAGADVTKATEAYQQGIDSLNSSLKTAQNVQQNAISAFRDSVNAQNAARKAQLDSQLDAMGMGAKYAQQQSQLNEIQAQGLERITRLAQERNAVLAAHPQADTSYFDAQIAIEKASLKTQIADQKDYYAKLAELQSSSSLGAQQAMADFVDQQKNMYQQAQQFVDNFTTGFGDAFASFVSGTESAKKAFGGFIDSMYKQALKFIANQAIAAIFKSFGTDTNTGESGGGWGSLISNFASAFGGGKAGGGSVAAGGLYRVNEQGPEVLNVGAQSYLMMGNKGGSVTPHSSVGGNVTVNQTVVVQSLSSRRTREQLAQETYQRQRIAHARNT